MSDPGGTTLDRKLVHVSEGSAASVIAALAEALGHRVSRGGSARRTEPTIDLHILEGTCPQLLEEAPAGVPVVVVASRRLRPGESQRLRAAGAARVFDAEACLLEVAFGLHDLLFTSCRAQRHYAEAFGNVEVSFLDAEGHEQRGALTGFSCRGGRVVSDFAPPEGATVALVAEIGPWEVPMPGRVAFVDGRKPGFGVEFALDHDQLAPRLERFLRDSSRPRRAARRSASGVSA